MLFAWAMGLCLSTFGQTLEPMHNNKGQFGYGERGSNTFTIKPQWDEAKPFNEYGVAIVRKGEMYGLIDKSGKAVGKALGYSIIEPYDGTDFWIVALGGKRTDTTPKNRTGLCVFGFKGSLSYVIKGAKWGLLRKDGQTVIEPKYDEISNLMDNEMIAFQKKNLYGFMNKNGVVVYPAKYDLITPFNNQGIAAVRNKKNTKWSLIDSSGKTVIPEEEGCRGFFSFKDDLIGSMNTLGADSVLTHSEYWGDPERLMPMMNSNFSWINSEHPYVVASKVSRNTSLKWEYALYDLKGGKIIAFGADLNNIFAPSEGVAVVYKNRKKGFFDLSTQTFTPTDNARTYYPMKEGHSMSYVSNARNDYYVVDKNGNKVSEDYDGIMLAGSRIIVRKGSDYGLITRQGKNIIPVECLSIVDANDGLFGVKASNEKFGYVDEDGNTIIPFDYDGGTPFIGNYAIVAKTAEGSPARKSGIIDKGNNVVVPLNYNKVCGYVDDNGKLQVWVAEDGNYSKVDESSLNGTSTPELSATNYTEMKTTGFGIVVKDANGYYGLLQNGKNVIPCSVPGEELVGKVFNVMTSLNMKEVSAVEAHRIVAWVNDARNSFKIGDTIDDNIWDF